MVHYLGSLLKWFNGVYWQGICLSPIAAGGDILVPVCHWDRLKVEFNACNGPFDDMFIFGQSFGHCSVMGDHL